MDEYVPANALELAEWLDQIPVTDFDRAWVAQAVLLLHDELMRCGGEELTERFPVGAFAKLLNAVRVRYRKAAAMRVRAGKRGRKFKLSPQQRHEIELSDESQRVLAGRYGVHRSTISLIRSG